MQLAPAVTMIRDLMKTTPYLHQKAEFIKHWDTKVRAIFWEQGTGKSKLIIDTACRLYLAGLIDCVIIIAPKGVHENWVSDEIPAHIWDDIPHRPLFWKGGYTKKEQMALAQLDAFQGLRFLTVNYQAVYDRKKPRSTKKILSKAKKMLKDFLTFKSLLILDESTAVKTPGSKTSRTVWGLSERVERIRIMSGMSVTNNPLDLYGQFRILGRDILGYKTFAEFKQHHAIIIKMDNYEIIKEYKNLDEMKERYDPYMTRVLKKDCLDLPEKLPPIKRYFELTPTQHRHYEELAETFLTELDTPCPMCDGERLAVNGLPCGACNGTGTIVDGRLAMVRRLRFQQICCGFVTDEDKTVHVIADPNPRIQLLRSILSLSDTPGIIWACFHPDLENIVDLLKSMKIKYVEYSGRVSDADKRQAKIDFQKTGVARILLATQSSAYSGHTFHRAEWNIYYSQTDNGEHRWQSEDRSHRAGLRHPVSYTDFFSDKPIEKAIMANLIKKKQYNEMMMGDSKDKRYPVPMLSKKEMLTWVE